MLSEDSRAHQKVQDETDRFQRPCRLALDLCVLLISPGIVFPDRESGGRELPGHASGPRKHVFCVCVVSERLLVVLFSQDLVTLDPSNFSLFSFRPPAMDLTTAYRYNQNMMEYYTCKSKSLV